MPYALKAIGQIGQEISCQYPNAKSCIQREIDETDENRGNMRCLNNNDSDDKTVFKRDQ